MWRYPPVAALVAEQSLLQRVLAVPPGPISLTSILVLAAAAAAAAAAVAVAAAVPDGGFAVSGPLHPRTRPQYLLD